MKAFEPAEKVGIIATVTRPKSSPHVASDICYGGKPNQMTVGEFCQGKSKSTCG